MSLTFNCKNCGSAILVSFLNTGDSARCKQCGIFNEVPADALETDEQPDYAAHRLVPVESDPIHDPTREKPLVIPSVLGPRDFKGVFKETSRIYRGNSVELLTIAAIFELPIFIINHLARLGMDSLRTGEVSPPAVIGFTIFLMISAAVWIISLLMLQATLIHGISQEYIWSRISIRRALRAAWSRLGYLLLTNVLVLIILAPIAFVYLVIVAATSAITGSDTAVALCGFISILVLAYIPVRLLFVAHATVIEGTSPGKAIRRSWFLVRGYWWWVFAVSLVMLAMLAGIGFIMNYIPIVGMISGILLTPLSAACFAVLYFDLRVKNDGYTPEHLGQDLGIQVDSAATSGTLEETERNNPDGLPGEDQHPGHHSEPGL
jgi:membrane-anchored glycerophosphoryl diester phosphodiesterase (GDPDase)